MLALIAALLSLATGANNSSPASTLDYVRSSLHPIRHTEGQKVPTILPKNAPFNTDKWGRSNIEFANPQDGVKFDSPVNTFRSVRSTLEGSVLLADY